MNCVNCNAPIAEGARFCERCGMPVSQPAPAEPINTIPVVEEPVAAPAEPMNTIPTYEPAKPDYQQPSYQQPSYQQPSYQQPSYQQPVYYPEPASQETTKGRIFSIISMATGLFSLAFCWAYGAGIPFGIVGFIFGLISKNNGKRGMATAGIITGIIGTVLSFIFFIAIFAFLMSEGYDYDFYY